MHRRKFFFLLLLLLLILLLLGLLQAVARSKHQAVPNRQIPTGTSSNIPAEDIGLFEISKVLPGFGGLFLDNSTVYVYLLDPTQIKEAEAVIRKVYKDDFISSAKEFKALQADYSFLQLYGWHERLSPELLSNKYKNVNSTDLDESKNRIRIGMTTLENRSEIEQAIVRLGVPLAAVNIEKAEPFRMLD